MMVWNARLVPKGTQPQKKEQHLVINAVNTVFFISFNNNTHYTQQFITARKRSLRQGNIFTSMSHLFCPRGVGCYLPSMHWEGGVGFPACTVKGDWLANIHWEGRLAFQHALWGGRGLVFQHASQFTWPGGRGSASEGRASASGERESPSGEEGVLHLRGGGGALHLMGICIQGERGSPSGRVCIWREGSATGSSASGGLADSPIPTPNREKWARRILLECFLVYFNYSNSFQFPSDDFVQKNTFDNQLFPAIRHLMNLMMII